MSRRVSRELLSFIAVGSIGFLIEAVILTILTRYAGWSPLQARVPSFFTAVTATWLLNRRHTFPERGLQRRTMEAFWYAAIQGVGVTINLILFGATLAVFPQFRSMPVIPLAVGSAGGLAFNFLMSSKVLYSRLRQGGA